MDLCPSFYVSSQVLEEDRSRIEAFPVLAAWLIRMSSGPTQASSLTWTWGVPTSSVSMVPRDARSSRDPRMSGEWCSSHPFSSDISRGYRESFIALLCYETKVYVYICLYTDSIFWIYIHNILVATLWECIIILLYISRHFTGPLAVGM